MTIKVKDIAHLRELIAGGLNRYHIRLKFGLISSKWIETKGNDFYVFHEIDGTDEVVTEEEIMDDNIGRAMNAGAFFAEHY